MNEFPPVESTVSASVRSPALPARYLCSRCTPYENWPFGHPKKDADLKQAMGSKVPARTKAKLRSGATLHITELEQSPERVKDSFQDKHVRYAA